MVLLRSAVESAGQRCRGIARGGYVRVLEGRHFPEFSAGDRGVVLGLDPGKQLCTVQFDKQHTAVQVPLRHLCAGSDECPEPSIGDEEEEVKEELADEIPACLKCGNEVEVSVLCRSCGEERSDATVKDCGNRARQAIQPAVAALKEMLLKVNPPSQSNFSFSSEQKRASCMSPSLESTSTAVPTSPMTPVPMTSQNRLLENLCCPSCGCSCTEDTKFCRHCGRRLIEDLRDSLLWKASGLPGTLPRQVISSPIDSVWKRASASSEGVPVSQNLQLHGYHTPPRRRPGSSPAPCQAWNSSGSSPAPCLTPQQQQSGPTTLPRPLARAWLVQEPLTPASGSLPCSPSRQVSSPSRHLGLTPPGNLLAAISGFPVISQGTFDSVGSLSEIVV